MDDLVSVGFYESIDDGLIAYSVIVARSGGKWVLCRHRDRQTLEVPGGHREQGETPLDAAKRELAEETGATAFDIDFVAYYGANRGGTISYGALYTAEITTFGELGETEIAEVVLLDEFPSDPARLTYPQIQPYLMRRVQAGGEVRCPSRSPQGDVSP